MSDPILSPPQLQVVLGYLRALEQGADAYRIFDEKRDECIKCVLIPQAA